MAVVQETVSREEWLEARIALLAEEKAFTRQRDALSAKRRQLPRVRVEKDYRFDSVAGEVSLGDLFQGRGQLLVYHFMFGPDWEEGCPSCSYWIDNFDGMTMHLAARDTSFVAVARAPLEKLLAYRKRMGWQSRFVSSHGSEFNWDYQVSFKDVDREAGRITHNYLSNSFPASEAPGVSVFSRASDGTIHHSYSTYGRGLDILNGTYNLLDLTPKGRDEEGLAYSMAWIRRHDQY